MDLRTAVVLAEGATTVAGVNYSDTAWGAKPEANVTLGYTNVGTRVTGTLGTGLVGAGAVAVTLPQKNGDYVLTHSTGDLTSFVKFTVSGYLLGTEGNPWLVGAGDDPASVTAVSNGTGAVFFTPARGAVTKEGLTAIADAMGDADFPAKLVSEDGTATNDVVMVLGASGAVYDTIADALASDDDAFKFYDVKGCVVNYDGRGRSGTMATDTFLPGIPTNLTANAYTAFGYEFQGWTTNGDTKVIFEDQAAIDDPQPGDIYDLQAVWKFAPVAIGAKKPGDVIAYLDEYGTLHIDGKGAMKDFTTELAPWAGFASDIKAIEVAEGVTKIGNAAFDSLDYAETTTALTFQGEDHVLNLLAFVSADGSKTNAPLAKAFSVYKDSSGTVEPIVTFQTPDLVYVYTKAPTLMRYGYDEVLLLTLPDLKAVQTAELIETAGELPYSKTMQALLDEALDKIDKATNYDEVMDGYVERWNQIKAQAEKDKSHEIEGSKITWRILDGTLVIAGEGEMPDFIEPEYPDGAPWNEMRADITNVTVAAGITSVGDAAFAVCPAVEGASVTFKDPEVVLNLGAFVSGDGAVTNVPAVKVEVKTEDGRTFRVVPGGWTDADDPNVTYDSLAEAIESGATAVVAAFEKKTDAGDVVVPPTEVEETVTVIDGAGAKAELMAKFVNDANGLGSDGEVGLASDVENIAATVEALSSNIVVTVKLEGAGTMDVSLSNACESAKVDVAPDAATLGFAAHNFDIDVAWSLGDAGGELTELPASIVVHVPMTVYEGLVYSVSRLHGGAFETLPEWTAETVDSDTAEWFKVDVARGEMVIKSRFFCPYAIGVLELEKTCSVIVGNGGKAQGEEDPKSVATNFQIRVTGALNVSDFSGYAKRSAGEAVGRYPITYILPGGLPEGFPEAGFTVLMGTFTIIEGEALAGAGTVKYPSSAKVGGVDTGYLKPGAKATWIATAEKGSVFAGWTAAADAPECVSSNLAAFSANELANKVLAFKVGATDQIRPTDIEANFVMIDADTINGASVTDNGARLAVESCSQITAAQIAGLPRGVKFSAKTLGFTGVWPEGTTTIALTLKNASGYIWKGEIDVVANAGTVAEATSRDAVSTDAVLMLVCDPAKGSTRGTGVYALTYNKTTGVWGKSVAIRATAAKDYVFAGWYEDPGFSKPAEFLTGSGKNAKPKDYRESSQNVTLMRPATAADEVVKVYYYARFIEKSTKADPIHWLRYAGAGYANADASSLAEEETWYQGVALPTNGCEILFGSASLPKVTVSGLPSGVKFDKEVCRFTGVPTACSTEKKPFFAVKIQVKNASGATDILMKNVRVEPLPKWAIGTFDGYHMDAGATNGTFTATVGKTGKVSGKTRGGYAATSFSAPAFSDVDLLADGSNLVYTADVTVQYTDPATKKTVRRIDALYLYESPVGLGVIGGGDENGNACLGVQRAWERKDLAIPAFDTKALKDPVELNNGLKLKFGANGKVSVSGVVPGDDLSPVSASGSTFVLPAVWTDEGMTNLLAQTGVYVTPKKNLKTGFCEVYNLLLKTEETGKKIEAVQVLSPLEYMDYPITGGVPAIERPVPRR